MKLPNHATFRFDGQVRLRCKDGFLHPMKVQETRIFSDVEGLYVTVHDSLKDDYDDCVVEVVLDVPTLKAAIAYWDMTQSMNPSIDVHIGTSIPCRDQSEDRPSFDAECGPLCSGRRDAEDLTDEVIRRSNARQGN